MNKYSQWILSETYKRWENREIKKLFSGQIHANFLINCYYKVFDRIAHDIEKYYDLFLNNQQIIAGETINITYEICCMIIGMHKSNTIFLENDEIKAMEDSHEYQEKLINDVINHIKIRRNAAWYFRNKQIIKGDRFIYFSVPYKLYGLCMQSMTIFRDKPTENIFNSLYFRIFNKCLAALTLLEDGFLDNAYPICRTVLEQYIQLDILKRNPKSINEYLKYVEYDIYKCCYSKYPDEFNKKFDLRKHKTDKSKIDYFHFGWVDTIDNYDNYVNKPYFYRIDSLIQYIENNISADEKNIWTYIKYLFKQCHSYSHGTNSGTRFPILHYMEISIMLYFVIINTYQMLCVDYSVSMKINDIDVLKDLINDFKLLIEQYNSKTTKLLENYYKH